MPPNDQCEGALPLVPNGQFEGTPLYAATASTSPYCGSYSYDYGSSVWYSIEGTGAVLKITACSTFGSWFDGTILVYSQSCDSLTCESLGYEAYGECSSGYGGSSATFFSQAGTTYYIMVRGYHGGSYNLTTAEIEVPGDNLCSGATPIESMFEGPTLGSTMAAVPVVSEPSCTWTSGTRGVWFSVVGTGDAVRVTTCSPELTFESAISVFEGDCDALECIAMEAYNVDYDECGASYYSASDVVWRTEEGVRYYIFVHGTYASSAGTFALSFETVDVPENDRCDRALLIEPNGDLIFGSNEDVIPDDVPACSSGSTSSGLWYAVEGAGSEIRASTCSGLTNFDSEISIYTDCTVFGCVGGNDDSCGTGR